MAFTSTGTGLTNRTTIVRGDTAILSGTWFGSAVVSGTISPGGTVVLAHGVTLGSASLVGGTTTPHGASASIFSAKNQTGNGDTRNGVIRVSSLDNSSETAGDWWAIVRI